jgi:hypothetical protein
MRWDPSHVNSMLAMRNLACNERWAEGWRAIRQTWQKNKLVRRAQWAVRPSSLGEQEVSSPPTLPCPEPPAESQPSLSVLTPTQQSPDVPPDPRPLRPAPTHPWRRPFLRRRSA